MADEDEFIEAVKRGDASAVEIADALEAAAE